MKKGKIVAGSILSIVLCSSLIAGATMALFTSESTTNIAVTSGNVDVIATINDLKTYSAKADSNGTLSDENGKAYSYTQTNAKTAADEISTFTNGGTAEISDGTLKLDKITPGDKATFRIDIKNKSTVSAQYRIKFSCVSGEGQSDNGTILMSGLDFMVGEKVKLSETTTAESLTGTTDVNGHTVNTWVAEESGETIQYTDEYSHISSYVSQWQNLDAGSDIYSKYIDVSLPLTAGNYYSGKSCVIKYEVQVVQGNAAVSNDDSGIQYILMLGSSNKKEEIVKDVSEINEKIKASVTDSGDEQSSVEPVDIVLAGDVTLEAPINVLSGSIVNMDLAGKTLTVNTYNEDKKSINNITVSDGAQFTLEGSKTGVGNIVIEGTTDDSFTGSNAAITISNDKATGETTVVNLDKLEIKLDATATRKTAIYAYSTVDNSDDTSDDNSDGDGIEINLGEDLTVNAYGGDNYCFVQAANNTTVNINGGEYNAGGYGSLFVVGGDSYYLGGSVLNFNEGTINVTDYMTAIECSRENKVYMSEGTINIKNSDTSGYDAYVMALGAVYGGYIEMSGGQINVAITSGESCVAVTGPGSWHKSIIDLVGGKITLNSTGGYGELCALDGGGEINLGEALSVSIYNNGHNRITTDSSKSNSWDYSGYSDEFMKKVFIYKT
jgi:predicted ribosomally synthesized peptide with SipW-like signal peptide